MAACEGMGRVGRKGGHKKAGGRDFVKGQSGNPSGYNGSLGTVAALKNETKVDLVRWMCECLGDSYADLAALVKDTELDPEKGGGSEPAGKLLVASIIKKGIDIACPSRSALILQYIVGKPGDFGELDEKEQQKIVLQAMSNIPSHLLTEVLKKAESARSGAPKAH